MQRRQFLLAAAAAGSGKTILLRSGWQSVNIGDIAHTPGVLQLIEKHIPDAAVILNCNALDRGVEPMLRKYFPRLEFVRGDGLEKTAQFDTAELREAAARAHLLLHGSGPSTMGRIGLMTAWRKASAKPYGYFGVGVTLPGQIAAEQTDGRALELIRHSRFTFTRETKSLENLRARQIQGPEMGFVPDGVFSFTKSDDALGDEVLRQHGLEDGKFICVIPRLRLTPYHKIRAVSWGPEETQRRTRINEANQEKDHAKFREVIVAWVRQTGGKVYICPEMTYELDIQEPLLFAALPEDVKKRVILRKSFWLPDEAASVYRRAAAVVSFECHSPIIAAAQGTPCVYVHQPEDGIKVRMWDDVGLGEWKFEVEETTGAAIAAAILRIGSKLPAARRKVRAATEKAQAIQAKRMGFVRRVLG